MRKDEQRRLWAEIRARDDAEQRGGFPWGRLRRALAGVHPEELLPYDMSRGGHEDVESWKTVAREGRMRARQTGEDMTPFYLLHAMSHWYRAWHALGGNDRRTRLYSLFPDGLPYRRYLSMWITCVAVPQLGLSPKQVASICEKAMVKPDPEPLLKVGYSYVFEK